MTALSRTISSPIVIVVDIVGLCHLQNWGDTRERGLFETPPAEGYYSDPLGSADWRLGVTQVLLAEIREELAA